MSCLWRTRFQLPLGSPAPWMQPMWPSDHVYRGRMANMAGQGSFGSHLLVLDMNSPFVGLRNPPIQALGKWRFRIEPSPTTSKLGTGQGSSGTAATPIPWLLSSYTPRSYHDSWAGDAEHRDTSRQGSPASCVFSLSPSLE